MKANLLIPFIDCVSNSLTIFILYCIFLLVDLGNIRCKYLFFIVDFTITFFYSSAL